jgi:AI-2 transport protein TqsA
MNGTERNETVWGITSDKVAVLFLGILTLVAVGVVLQQAQSVVLPLIIAWLLSYILAPVVSFLTRRRIPVALAVSVVLLLVVGVCYLAAIFLHARISAFVEAYPKYHARFQDLTLTLQNRWALDADPFAGIDWDEQIRSYLVKVSKPLVSFTSSLLMVMFFLIFFLLGKPYFQPKVRAAFSPDSAEQITRMMTSISSQIGRYLYVQLMASLVTGVLVGLALRLIGVDFAITWGALAFFLNFIPTLGSIVASIPPILLAVIQFYPNLWPAVITLVAVLTIQMSIGNVAAPKIMGDRLNLSPVVVLLSLVFWGWLWGVVGALLSVPIAAAIKIVCENVEPLRPISVFMGTGKNLPRGA